MHKVLTTQSAGSTQLMHVAGLLAACMHACPAAGTKSACAVSSYIAALPVVEVAADEVGDGGGRAIIGGYGLVLYVTQLRLDQAIQRPVHLPGSGMSIPTTFT